MRTNFFQNTVILLLFTIFTGCQKSHSDLWDIVSTEELHNYHGTIVEVCYSNDTKMYFHLLSDTTAEVVNYSWFFSDQERLSPWVYRGDVVVPQNFVHQDRTYTVTCIGDQAFYNRTDWDPGDDGDVSLITSVALPNTIDTIRESAFSGCSCIASLTIPSSVKYLGHNAFSGTKITTMELPDAIEEIPDGLFSGCSSLSSVIMSKNVVGIGDGAFYATGFTSFEIPETVQYIGMDILYYCRKLKTLYCHPTTPPIKNPNNFYGSEDFIRICDSLESIYVPEQSVELYKSDPAWRMYKDIIVGM